MHEAEAEAAAPSLKDALYVHYEEEPNGLHQKSRSGRWVPLGAATARIRISDGTTGLNMVEMIYESEKKAGDELEAAWGKPFAGDSGFGWLFWYHSQGGVRAILMNHEEKGRSRLELSKYQPLAKVIERALFTRNRKSILGASREDLCDLPVVLARYERETHYALPATEHSSGSIPMLVTWENGHVAKYKFQLDYTYHHPDRDEIARQFEKHFGKPSKKDESYRKCLQFGVDPIVLACDGRSFFPNPVTVWTIEVLPAT